MRDVLPSRDCIAQSTVRAFVLELEKRFDCTFFSAAGALYSAALGRSFALVEIVPRQSVLRVSSLLRAAEPDLTADAAFALLIRHFPDEALAGTGVRENTAHDALEIFREASLKMLSVAGVAAYVADHVSAALSFNRWLGSNRLCSASWSAYAQSTLSGHAGVFELSSPLAKQ